MFGGSDNNLRSDIFWPVIYKQLRVLDLPVTVTVLDRPLTCYYFNNAFGSPPLNTATRHVLRHSVLGLFLLVWKYSKLGTIRARAFFNLYISLNIEMQI